VIVAVGGDGNLKSVTGLGLVADVFGDPSWLASLPGPAAIGHMRYSTVGASRGPTRSCSSCPTSSSPCVIRMGSARW
jgi:glutamine phosphoribosylpyrophosphate amidotransferase